MFRTLKAAQVTQGLKSHAKIHLLILKIKDCSYWNPHVSWENHHFLVEHRFWHHLEECFGPGLNLRDAFAAALRTAAGLVDGIGGTPATGPGRAWETIWFPMLFSMVFHRFSMFFQVFHWFSGGFHWFSSGFPWVFHRFSTGFPCGDPLFSIVFPLVFDCVPWVFHGFSMEFSMVFQIYVSVPYSEWS